MSQWRGLQTVSARGARVASRRFQRKACCYRTGRCQLRIHARSAVVALERAITRQNSNLWAVFWCWERFRARVRR